MKTLYLINEILSLGCQIWVEGENLRIRPGGVLTDELRAEVQAHKPELLAAVGVLCGTCAVPVVFDRAGGKLRASCPRVRAHVKNDEHSLVLTHKLFSSGHSQPCEACGWEGLTLGGKCISCRRLLEEAARRARKTIYTAGYGGLDFPAFKRKVEQLKAVVFDIRFPPQSKEHCWTKSALERALKERYRHVGALGNRNHDDRSQAIEIADLDLGLDLVLKQPGNVILLCGCPAYLKCHRLIVATRLDELGYTTREINNWE